MYLKILVPLGKFTKETGDALDLANALLAPGGEGILLHVIPTGVPLTVGHFVMPPSQVEEDERVRAMRYLGDLVDQLRQAGDEWRCEVVVSDSIAREIVTFAVGERADLIAMYDHDQPRPANVKRTNIIETVRQKSPIEVRVPKPRDLASQGIADSVY